MPLLRSWVTSANDPEAPFPLNNLPCGVFSMGGEAPRCGVAIGDMILDMAEAERRGLITLASGPAFDAPSWNALMARGPQVWAELRRTLQKLLAEDGDTTAPLVLQSDAIMYLPFEVAEFTDFYASRHHATNVGTMFRGAENALPPNWLHMPIGYNGRASTVVVSGTEIVRPNGQTKTPDADVPAFGPSQRLDLELELGAIVGTPSRQAEPVTVEQAEQMIFGYVLLNDWSTRDIQAWEYQPLGPFQSKAFATTISPWIVTAAALEPFRRPTPALEVPLLPYLQTETPTLYDIDLSVTLAPDGQPPTTITRTNYDRMYYSNAQQLAHHASSGCAMRTGDLLGSGTISGPAKSERGCLLELTWNGAEPLTLDSGETRTFLEDGDTVTLHGSAQGDGYRIGFGECAGTIAPARKG